MNLNTKVLFNNPPFKTKVTSSGSFEIREQYQSEDVLHTLFILLMLFWFSFMAIISTDFSSLLEFIQQWPFVLGSIVAILLLIYKWHKGSIVFDNAKGFLKSNLYQNKFTGGFKVDYKDVVCIKLTVMERLNESDKIYLKYSFSLKLKSGESIYLLTVYRKKHGRRIKTDIATHVNIPIKEVFKPLD